MVHLGVEPGTKAYRLLDPISKTVTVSRDVVFNEDKEWNWNETDMNEDAGSFTFDISGVEDKRDQE